MWKIKLCFKHPGIKAKNGDGSSVNTKSMAMEGTSKVTLIKEEFTNRNTTNERASKLEIGIIEDSGAKKVCNSSKCSCPEAVQYRKKYQLQLQQQLKKQHEQQQKSFVKKEIVTSSNSNICDNPINRTNTSNNTTSKSFHQECVVLQPGSKRSYSEAMMGETQNIVGDKRASNTTHDNLTSAFQHPSSNSDRNSFYSGNMSNNGNNFNNNLHRHRLQQNCTQNHLGNSSRSGKTNHNNIILCTFGIFMDKVNFAIKIS